MKKLFVGLACLLAVSATVDAATYYVSPAGSDANPGTEALPWQTIKKAANFSLQPGDTVLVHAGEYSGAGFRFTKVGTSAAPITYKAFGDGEVRITNSYIVPSGSWTWVQGAIYSAPFTGNVSSVFQNRIPLLVDTDVVYSLATMVPNSVWKSGTTLYAWLEDGSNPNDSVMRFSSGHVVELDDCHYSIFEGLTLEYGFNGFKDQGAGTHHITYRNNTIRSIRSQGIQPVGPQSVIEGNLFQMIGTNKYQHGIYTATQGTVIRHNVFEEIAGAAIHLYNGAIGGGQFQIYGNISRKPRAMTVPTSGNRYYTDYIIWEAGSNVVYNNVIDAEGKRACLSLNSPNNQIFHNTFMGCKPAISFSANQPGNVIQNNIFLQDGTPGFLVWPSAAGAQTLDYNVYFNSSNTPKWQRNGTTYTDFALYRAAAGEVNSQYVDPALVGGGDANLQPGSPAIDAGMVLTAVTMDYDGTTRPQGLAYDVGAYEVVPPELQLAPGVIIANSNNFASANTVTHLFDGCTLEQASCTAGNQGIASFWVTLDLGAAYELTRARLFGDATGTWKSVSWSAQTACFPEGPWTNVFTNRPSLGNQWFEEALNVGGRYVRVEVFGNLAFPPGRTEARELEVYGRIGTCP